MYPFVEPCCLLLVYNVTCFLKSSYSISISDAVVIICNPSPIPCNQTIPAPGSLLYQYSRVLRLLVTNTGWCKWHYQSDYIGVLFSKLKNLSLLHLNHPRTFFSLEVYTPSKMRLEILYFHSVYYLRVDLNRESFLVKV